MRDGNQSPVICTGVIFVTVAERKIVRNQSTEEGLELNRRLETLHFLLPNTGYSNLDLLTQIENGTIELPTGAECWWALPNIWGNERILSQFGGSISAALHIVLDVLEQTRGGKFINYEGQLGPHNLMQLKRTEEALLRISKSQGDAPVLILPAQMGSYRCDDSVYVSRNVFHLNEFGLGAFAVGIMLLTDPDCLQDPLDRRIDCPGDVIKSKETGEFSNSPYFGFEIDNGLMFDAGSIHESLVGYGAATGFLLG